MDSASRMPVASSVLVALALKLSRMPMPARTQRLRGRQCLSVSKVGGHVSSGTDQCQPEPSQPLLQKHHTHTLCKSCAYVMTVLPQGWPHDSKQRASSPMAVPTGVLIE